MELQCVFLILCAVFAAGQNGVYDACALTHRLSYYDISTHYPLVGNISFAICIAGYRHYNPAHQLVDRHGVTHYGIFGLRDVDSQCNHTRFYGGYSFEVDLICLNRTVLNDTSNVHMYNRLCAADLVRVVNCTDRLGNMVSVSEPVYMDLFDETLGEEDRMENYLADRDISYHPTITTTTTTPPPTTTHSPTTTTRRTTTTPDCGPSRPN